jgi:hypothetical protein
MIWKLNCAAAETLSEVDRGYTGHTGAFNVLSAQAVFEIEYRAVCKKSSLRIGINKKLYENQFTQRALTIRVDLITIDGKAPIISDFT